MATYDVTSSLSTTISFHYLLVNLSDFWRKNICLRTDGRTDRQTDGQMDRRKNGQSLFLRCEDAPIMYMVEEEEEQVPRGTMVENRKKHRQNSHLIDHCPTSEGVSEESKRANE